jgi:4-amino-4-deoxy-L-arabinose transferase-like glycosyltransferase
LVRRIVWLLILIAAARIVSTYWILNHTMDEPFFISCGLEWLDDHAYTYMPEQPPLSHITAGIGAKLAGAHNVPRATYQATAPLILYDSPSYWRTLASARAGELPFFILAALMVWLWARRLHGNLAALAAVLLFTTLPTVLGHAGLATTDIAICAMLPAALYALVLWLDKPGVRQAVWLALAVAGGVLSKFSFLLFFPVSAAVILWLRGDLKDLKDWRRYARPLLSRLTTLVPAAAGCFLLIWACYWFSLGPLFQGLDDLSVHAHQGHLSYLFGEQRTTGWWYFFPVVLAYKTPLAFLVLALLASIWLKRGPREHWIPLACAGAILISAMPSSINIGVRHILPIYPLLAIPAGLAAARLIESTARAPRILGGFLILAQIAASVAAHPNYIAYFNELAGGKPERVRVDSDLDWGQDFDQLAGRLRARGIKEPVALGGFGCVNPSRHGLGDAYSASPWQPSIGWVAVSATERYMSEQKAPDGSQTRPWSWLDRYEPVERIGGGAMLLYYVPR